MRDSDKKPFKLMLDTMCEATGQDKFDKERLIAWWTELNVFTLEEIQIKIDLWIEQNNSCPSLADLIVRKEKPKMGIPRTVTPLMQENNKRHVEEVKQDIKSFGKRRDFKKWAHDILNNPSAYPDISLRYAREALNVTDTH